MKAYVNQEWMELQEALEEIAATCKNRLQQAERSYYRVQEALQRIKEYIAAYDFADKEEEIYFFKEIKPQFLSELIFHMKVFYVEADRPVGNHENLIAYYNHVMENTAAYFGRHHNFYIYYRMGRTVLDHQYFVRTAEKLALLPEYSLDNDPKFSNAYSYRLAKMQAYERLNEYITATMHHLNGTSLPGEHSGKTYRPRLKWTDAKVKLIELVYGLFAKGSVDNGNADIKSLMEAVQYMFNIDLGNYYAVFQQNIRIRKKKRTVFIDELGEYLERRMDELDDNPRMSVL